MPTTITQDNSSIGPMLPLYDPVTSQDHIAFQAGPVQVDAAGTSYAPGMVQAVSAVSGYVVAYGSNANALTSSTDYAFKWGVSGTTVVNHLMIQNNTALNLNFDLDVAATAGSPILAPGQTLFFDVQTTVVHLFQAGTPNVNGTSAANIVIRGWL